MAQRRRRDAGLRDACELLKDTIVGDVNVLHANALKARKYKGCTPLQEAILTYNADLKDWLHTREISFHFTAFEADTS